MRESFDVVILGCGEAGIFAAYELEKLNPGLKLLAIDQGPDIYHRSCPIVSGKVRECIHCPICHTMCGFGGAGAFSDAVKTRARLRSAPFAGQMQAPRHGKESHDSAKYLRGPQK